MLKGKRSTQKEIDGFVSSRYFIAWMGSVSSIDVMLDDLSTSTGWGLHDLHELHIYIYIYIYIIYM